MSSLRYKELLQQMVDLHDRKSAGYTGGNVDAWANFRRSLNVNIPASTGAFIRLGDKIARAEALIRNPLNEQVGESLKDTLMDAAAYSLITICLLEDEENVDTTSQNILALSSMLENNRTS